MTTFQQARAFLLEHRSDYDTAVADFRWPDPVPFNWALDWFDAELGRNPERRDRPALWIVDAGSNRETKTVVRNSVAPVQSGGEFPARAGAEAR